jgi:hypothetical protein
VKRVWRTIYSTTAATTLAGLGGVAYCVATDRPLGAIGCLALFLVGVIGLRTAYEIDILQRRRMRLAEQERLFEAERGVYDRDLDRARRELADQERVMRKALDAERAQIRADLDAERDRAEVEFANRKALVQRAAFAKGFEMGQHGVLTEQRHADVIVLPVGANTPTIMGTGTTNQ